MGNNNEKAKKVEKQFERQISEQNTLYHNDRKARNTVVSNGSKDIDIMRMTGVNQSENKKE